MEAYKKQQITNFIDRLHDTQRKLLTPPPDLTLSQWATHYLYLSPEASSLPGKFSFLRAPFQREVFDSLSNPDVHRVVIMSASQVLKTQAILSYIGYIVHLDPGPILNVQPTGKQADSFSKDRLDTMFRDVPELRERIPDKKKRDSGNTIKHKRFPGGYIAIATSNSPSDLAARPIRFLFCDEIDRYEPTSEGDPIDIAEKRTTTFWNKKIVMVSSPGDDDISRISREYKRSDQRIFLVPCHHCGFEQKLTWGVKDKQGGVKFDRNDGIVTKAYYECVECGEHWNDSERSRNVQKGYWQPTAKSDIHGYHISAMYSSFITLKDLVEEFLASLKDPEQHKVFTNTRLGETWESDSSRVKDINFLNRLQDYTPEQLPDDVLLITAGVDVQIDRLEMEVVGWGVDDESWSIEFVKIIGDPTGPAPWQQLESFLSKNYKRSDGLQMRINAMCIDSGGEMAPDNLFAFCRKHSSRNVFAIKGAPGRRPIFPTKTSRHKSGGHFKLIGVDSAKSYFYSQLTYTDHGPNYCHFPISYRESPDYFEGLTSENCIVKVKRGVRTKVWIKEPGIRNEPLDCRVYALAARKSIQFLNLHAHKNTLLKRIKSQPESDEKPEEKSEKDDQESYTKKIMKSRRPSRNRKRSGYVSGLS